jgi:hypothetical protein
MRDVNEKKLGEPLHEWVFGGDIELELIAADSQFETGELFKFLESYKLEYITLWSWLKGRVNSSDSYLLRIGSTFRALST